MALDLFLMIMAKHSPRHLIPRIFLHRCAPRVPHGEMEFLRAFARGNTPDGIGVYQYSEDGVEWQTSQDTPDFAPSDCTYGLGRFVCTRADSISWSTDGRAITHEPALGDFRLNQIVYREDVCVAVGRGARDACDLKMRKPEHREFWHRSRHLSQPCAVPDIMVAAGGINRYFISYSTDNGQSWEDVPYGGCQGNYTKPCVPQRTISRTGSEQLPPQHAQELRWNQLGACL